MRAVAPLLALLFGCSTLVGLQDASPHLVSAVDGGVDGAPGDAGPGDARPEPDAPVPDATRPPPPPDDGVVDPDAAAPPPPPGDAGCVPAEESCNGADDDCDGQVDEDLRPPACASQEGVCAGSTRVCGGAQGWLPCDERRLNLHDPSYTPVENALNCDGRDNDCDGETDEGCECRPGDQQACGSDVGECRAGRQVCEDGSFGACDAVGPEREACNGRDDDCDGDSDEDAECPADQECVRGECERVRWVFEAESGANGHDVGRREADGWSASTGPDRPGFLVYGPYTRDVPAGTFDVRFRLMVDIVDADNSDVVRLEINDFDQRPDCGDCLLARRTIRRREFGANMRYQDFTLRFENPGGRRLEFRTYWTDRAYVRQDRVEVVPAP